MSVFVFKSILYKTIYMYLFILSIHDRSQLPKDVAQD